MNGFRTCLVHSCFSQDLSEPRPVKCKCRKLVSKETAIELVKNGTADWLVSYEDNFPKPTWNIVYRGRKSKTPRVSSSGRTQIERGLEKQYWVAEQTWLLSEDRDAKRMEAMIEGAHEQIDLFEIEHDIAMEERCGFFHGCGKALLEHKKFSDTFGTVEGDEGKYVTEIIKSGADQLKLKFAMDDPFEGRCLFPMIGQDERTKF